MWMFRKRAADDEIADLLDQCLTRIERGEATVESCLAAHPEHAAELRPVLMTAAAVRSVDIPDPAASAQARIRARVLAAAAPRPMPVRRRPLWQPVATAGVALALLAVLAVPLTALQSRSAVPGDWNYGLKRAGERVRLAVTVSDDERRSVHLALAERREREIQSLLRQNRAEDIPFVVAALLGEWGSIADSLSRDGTIAPSEAQRISEITERQERVLKQVVEQTSQEVASVAQAARVTASETRNAAQQAAERRDPAPTATPTPTPAPVARNQSTDQSPTPTATPVASPSATPEPSESPSPSPSASPDPSASPSPSPSVSPSPSALPTPNGPNATLPPVRTSTVATPSPAPVVTPPPATLVPGPVGTPLPPLNTGTPTVESTPMPGSSIPGLIPPVQSGQGTPAPTATPAPTPSSVGSRTVPAPGREIVPGIVGAFTYTGPTQSLLVLLAPAQGKYTYVAYRAPGGQWITYRPGDAGGEQLTVPAGSEVIINVTDTVYLTW